MNIRVVLGPIPCLLATIATFGCGRDEVAANGLRKVFFLPHHPREQVRFSLTLADVHLVSLKPELEGLILPSKAYGVFAAGRPVIFMGAADGEIGRLLVEADCGEVVRSGDCDALVSSILGMMNAPDRGEAMGQRARALFEQRFSKTAALAAWDRLLVEAGNR
jgi:glycosyltransferase involved in cell wall biosynthesis